MGKNNNKEQLCHIIISPDEIIVKRALSVDPLATVPEAPNSLLASRDIKDTGEKGSVRAIFLHEEVLVSPLVSGSDEPDTYKNTELLGVIGPDGLAIPIEGLLDGSLLTDQLSRYQKEGVPLIINGGSIVDTDQSENNLSTITPMERELARLKAENALRQILSSQKQKR